jgi:hypothetical protein
MPRLSFSVFRFAAARNEIEEEAKSGGNNFSRQISLGVKQTLEEFDSIKLAGGVAAGGGRFIPVVNAWYGWLHYLC